jgi:hypothetical protein
MTIRFRILIALAALVGLAVAQVPRATAAEGQGQWLQCWYQPGVDPPNSCSFCSGPCMGSGYVCCNTGEALE